MPSSTDNSLKYVTKMGGGGPPMKGFSVCRLTKETFAGLTTSTLNTPSTVLPAVSKK